MGGVTERGHGGLEWAPRLVIGLIWIVGAFFNLVVTMRMESPFGWLEESAIRPWGWFFSQVVSPHGTIWIVLLVVWEFTLGAMTLARGQIGRFGLAGGALFSGVLFSFWTPYTMMMGPYAVLLGRLAGRQPGQSVSETPRERFRRHLPPVERSAR